MQPISLFYHGPSPNPWKVVIILEELGLPYELKGVSEVKGPEFTKINPNGRLPAIIDPNTGLTLWESGAILEYLVEQYDKEGRISDKSLEARNHERQYLHFQMSGQGPYYGQASWFAKFHPEKVQSAIDRYNNEAKRVATVLDGIIAKSSSGWLVGDKCTYADLSFLVWAQGKDWIFPDAFKNEDLPHYAAWVKKMEARPSVQKMAELRSKELPPK